MAGGEDDGGSAAAALLAAAGEMSRRRRCREGCPGCRLEEANKASAGVPYLNFFYIWVVCLTAALPIQSLFPYLYFMIRDLKVAKEEQDIGFYAGFVGATYFLGRTISAVPWGMFADKYGRKPCIVISILSVVVFNTLFGLSTTYWMAIVTRGLLGLLCGILGPIKAYASEVCRKEHQALGISLVTSSRAIALVIGPAIGGFLAQPAQKYPNLFSEESIFGRFPYFLPCFVISVLAAGSCVACIWLPETLHFHNDDKVEAIDELEAQAGDSNLEAVKAKESRGESTKNLLKNWQLMSAVILYCIFSLHDTAYLEIFSLWAVSSRKFRGLSLTSQDVGTVLAVSGFGVLVYQLAIYPFLAKYLGPIKPFRPAAVLSILLLATYPFMANLDGLELKILINIASLLKNMFAATITIACNIMQNTAVTQEQRGVANGISVTLMSMFKAVAPAAAGILFSWAQKHISGQFLPGDQILFLILNMVSIIGLVLTFKPFFSLPNVMSRS
ncbi:unnamed protein product [Urochloa decumbens]|uniref:Major facilitator superfamily (MFS) profile domain-containing protein n=1 Tax=Urochloa decumbens TaxID=240449 RepID=A0ABC8YVY3_9POAL